MSRSLKKLAWTLFIFLVICAGLCWAVLAGPNWVGGGMLLLAIFFLSTVFSSRVYLLSLDVKIRLLVFGGLFLAGVFAYCTMPVHDRLRDEKVRVVSSLNRVIASLFPSRGGFEAFESQTQECVCVLQDVRDGGERLKTPSPASAPNDAERQFLYYSWHLAVVTFVTMLLYSEFFGLYCIGYVHRWLNFRFKKRSAWIFWGDCEAARVLAKSVRNEGYDVIFQIARDSFSDRDITRNMVLNLFKHQNCVVAFVKGLPDETHDKYSEGERIRLEEIDVYSDHHFILGEDSRFNVRLAKAIVDTRKRVGLKGAVNIFVRIENSLEDGLLCEWIDVSFKHDSNVFIHVIRETGLLAEKYIGEYPILAGCYPLIVSNPETGLVRPIEGHEGVRVLVIGFGCRGQALTNIMIENSRFIMNEQNEIVPFSADIITKDEESIHTYKSRCKETWDAYNLSAPYGVIDVTSTAFDDIVLADIDRLQAYGRIIICTGDDDLNISVANKICKQLKSQGKAIRDGMLFVQLTSEEVYNRLICDEVDPKQGDRVVKKNIPSFEHVVFFGMWNDLFTYENVVEKEWNNEGARWLNWYYCCQKDYDEQKADAGWKVPGDAIAQGKFASEKERWRIAEWFDKLSSQASCVGQRNLLALLGLKTVPATTCGAKDESEDFSAKVFKDGKIGAIGLLLARNEHERWMAFMRTHGVLSWNLTEPDMESVKKLTGVLKPNRRVAIGRHAAIIAFDDLPLVDLTIAIGKNPDLTEGIEAFEGRGSGIGFETNLQWNDIKFVKWIPELMRLCGRKIVKM